MRHPGLKTVAAACAVGILAAIDAAPSTAFAVSNEELLQRLESVEQEVKDLKTELKKKEGVEKELETVKGQLKKTEGMAKELQDVKTQLTTTQKKAEEANRAAAEPDTREIKFHLSGGTVADFTATDSESMHNSFGGGKFLPIFLAQYQDWLLMEAHLEFTVNSEGETTTSLEYAQLDANVADWLTFVGGKFLSPIGQFQQALHPPWINKLPDRPAGFVEDGGDEPLNEIGVMARGGVSLDDDMAATYAVFVGNGPHITSEGISFEGITPDNNGNKAYGGRVSILPVPHLEVGVSGMAARVSGIEPMVSGAVTTAGFYLIDGDFAYTNGPWDIRGEYIHSRLDDITSALDPSDPMPTMIPRTTWNNWYVQAAYRLMGITEDPVISKFEPVVRWGKFHVNGFEDFAENEENRISFGLDYWFGPSVVAKIAYEDRNYLNKAAENIFRAQFAFGF